MNWPSGWTDDCTDLREASLFGFRICRHSSFSWTSWLAGLMVNVSKYGLGSFMTVLLLILLNYLNIRIQMVYHNGVPNLMNCTEGTYSAMRIAFQASISLQCPPCIVFPVIFMFPGVLRLVYWLSTLSPFLLCLFKSWRTCVLVLQVPKALN